MASNTSAIFVAVVEQTAYAKVAGRANFNASVELKTLAGELRAQGIPGLVLDLTECVTMDSTFLGGLVSLAVGPADGTGINYTMPEPGQPLRLLNPNARITDLLENLGVGHLFQAEQHATPPTLLFEPMHNNRPVPTPEELSRNCLEAHELLMKVNPENIPKFKDVAKFLAEDLKKKAQG